MSSGTPTGAALETGAPQAPGAARTSRRLPGAVSLTSRRGTASRISHRHGARGSHPSACSVHRISAGPSLLISSRRRSTSRHHHTTLDASRHTSCRTSFLHGIPSNRRRIRRTHSTTHRETSQERWFRLLITTRTRGFLLLGYLILLRGVGTSILISGRRLLTALMARRHTCVDRPLLTSLRMTPAWCPTCPTSTSPQDSWRHS